MYPNNDHSPALMIMLIVVHHFCSKEKYATQKMNRDGCKALDKLPERIVSEIRNLL